MKIIGFNFTKFNVEKKSNKLDKIKLSTSINILELNQVNSDIFNQLESLLGIRFDSTINYGEEVASLKFDGNLLLSIESNKVKEIMDKWKDKKLPEPFKLGLYNHIFKKVSFRALQFEEEFNLPPHVPFPSFKAKK